MVDDRAALEVVGPHYDYLMMLEARARTRSAIHKIAARITPGMVEADAVEQAREILRADGLLRGWHGVYVRFGPNTVKIHGTPSRPGVVLQENDIFLIDIGPVFGRWEGDGGDTFVVGQDSRMKQCAQDVHRLFDAVRAHWRVAGATGAELYRFAERTAQEMGWVLNLGLAGHRLADFPHTALYKGALADAGFTPAPGLWVLEMHIRHPQGLFGAFYEDMLLEDGR